MARALQPNKDYILTEIVEDEYRISKGGLVLPDKIFNLHIPVVCKVVAIGKQYKGKEIKVGSLLVVERTIGADINFDGKEYRLLRPKTDILGLKV